MFLAAPIPGRLLEVPRWPPGRLGALISRSQPARPGPAAPGPGPALYLRAQTSAWRAAGQGRPGTPRKLAGSTPPRSSILTLWGSLPASRGAPAARPASPPASWQRQPSGEKKGQENKSQIRINKAVVGSPAIARAPRQPAGGRGAPVIFCYIIFLVKYFPGRRPRRRLTYHGDAPKSMRTHLLTFLHSFWI